MKPQTDNQAVEAEAGAAPAASVQDEKPGRLRAALERARQTEAERTDVIADLREAEYARLEILKEALADVFEKIPPGNDLLECAITPGPPPRLWIDVLAHVTMGRDKRTYRFVKDTREGRQVVLETANAEEMADRVADYVAHRIIERERALEADHDRTAANSNVAGGAAPGAKEAPKQTGSGAQWVSFVTGVLVGALGLFAYGLWRIGG